MTNPGSTRGVIRAIYELHGRTGRWPTRREIAAYLETSEAVVKPALLDLRNQRLMRDRRRGGETVWMPWRES